MRIGILTYHRAHNFGAVLQAYALRTYLKDHGYIVEFIDYWPRYRKGMYDLFPVDFKNRSLPHNVKQIVKTCFIYFKKRKRYDRFQEFIANYLEVNNSKKIQEGKDIPDSYDYIIFGSDQIWRYNEFISYKGFDPVYWGEFPKNSVAKKITYAASMGKMMADKIDSNDLVNHLNNFHSISIREKKLQEYVQSIYDKKVFHVLDPVFLLDKKQWEDISKITNQNEKYLLLYNLNSSKDADNLAVKIAGDRNIIINELTGSVNSFLDEKRYKQKYGPLEFLSAIRDADFVVATSFHGVAFSILFEKQFIALGMKDNAERVKGLLAELGIEDRYIDDVRLFLTKEINYSEVNLKLEALKQGSKSFISSSLS